MVSRPVADAALESLNGLAAGELASALTACCAGTTRVARVPAGRPYEIARMRVATLLERR